MQKKSRPSPESAATLAASNLGEDPKQPISPRAKDFDHK
jgi:hypothetical protein